MGGAGEANGGLAGMRRAAARDESFKRPGAIPFKWEVSPGVPKEVDESDYETSPASPPRKHPLSLPHTPTSPPPAPQPVKLAPPPQSAKLAPPLPSFRQAGAVPFLWEDRPGVPKQLYQYDVDDTPSPSPPQSPKLALPPYLAPPPYLARSASAVPGPRHRRDWSSLSFSESLSFSKPRRSGKSPSRFASGSNWRFWERGRSGRDSFSSPSSSALSSEAAALSEIASPRLSTGSSSETASSISD